MSECNWHLWTEKDFCRLLDATGWERTAIAEEIGEYQFRYRPLTDAECVSLAQNIRQSVDGFTQVGEHRTDIWESCWSDHRATFLGSAGELASINPNFMSSGPILRLDGRFVQADDVSFETRWFAVLRRVLFERTIKDVADVWEFGSGSGFNLAAAARLNPSARIVGLDWSPSAVALANDIGLRHGLNVSGQHFDFFAPAPALTPPAGFVAMTFAALEQTGERCVTFLDWLLGKRPSLVLSMEPLIELYDPNSVVDQLAIRYHRHRNYLDGYLTWVRRMEAQGKIEIITAKRLCFGSKYHEAYSVLIWKPVG